MIKKKLHEQDEAERIVARDAREIIFEFLTKSKGYEPKDIETDIAFPVKSGEFEDTTSVDFIITVKRKRYIAIKCTMAIESRERHVLAFSRVVEPCQIPYSVVTDGIIAHVLDTVSGKMLSDNLDGIPSREKAMEDIEQIEFVQYPPEKLEMQKRILLAFEFASCPKPKT